MKPTICFATMCKNEEHCIKDTLESVYKYIDHWIVYDTGSTDRTQEIVETFFKEKNIPGKFYTETFEGFDKSKTKMIACAKDKADYIMHLDADDLLAGDFVFPENDPDKDSYYMNVRRGGSNYKALILFKASYTWKFCGVAHTTIKCLEKPNFSMGDISDSSYIICEGIGSRAFDPKKFFYDAERLQKQFFDTLIEDPDDLNNRSAFYTAQSYMDYGMYTEALQWNKLYLKLNNTWIEERFEAQLRIGKIYISMDADIELIEHEMKKAIEIFPDRAEPYHYMGIHFNRLKDYEKGYYYLNEAVKKDLAAMKNKYILFVDESAYGKWNYDELSVSCFWTNRPEQGVELINAIVDDVDFQHHKPRLLDNLNHFKTKYYENHTA
jgi:glycosyltransferase involved in cell wall biosynthesis